MTTDRAHRGRITATEVAKALRWSMPHQPVSRGTSTEPPPPPKKPLAAPASAPHSQYRRIFFIKNAPFSV